MANFKLGRLLSTPGAIEAARVAGDCLLTYIQRHAAGGWGVVGDEDKRANDRTQVDGSRLLSACLLWKGSKV